MLKIMYSNNKKSADLLLKLDSNTIEGDQTAASTLRLVLERMNKLEKRVEELENKVLVLEGNKISKLILLILYLNNR